MVETQRGIWGGGGGGRGCNNLPWPRSVLAVCFLYLMYIFSQITTVSLAWFCKVCNKSYDYVYMLLMLCYVHVIFDI